MAVAVVADRGAPITRPRLGGETPALEARDVVREFGPTMVAVDGIDLRLQPGEFLTVFGPNGAGKSTLLGLLAGRLRPTRGEISVRGQRLDPGSTEWRSDIGVLSHHGMLYPHLTASENLRFFGRLFGLDALDERVERGLARVDLSDRRDSRVHTLSHGMRQRLAMARALLHDPYVILLDEPYTGLDPHAASVLQSVLMSLRDGQRTVVMVTHNLVQGLQMSTRLAIQVRGRLVWEAARGEVDGRGFESVYHEVVAAR